MYWFLTILILVSTLILFLLYKIGIFSIEETTAIGSLLAGAGSLIAVVWFYKSLRQQGEQLTEQNKQFQQEVSRYRQEGFRSNLLTAKKLFEDMEKEINEDLKDLCKLEELPTFFLKNIFEYLKPITESKDYNIVMESTSKASAMIVTARKFLATIQLAAILFLENDGISVLKYYEKPEWFVVLYKDKIQSLPLFTKYFGIAILLAEFMVKIKLDLVSVASCCAMALFQPRLMIQDETLKIVLKCQKEHKTLPNIAEKWLQTIPKEKIKEFSESL